jgi:hypothetical protein
MFFSVVRNWERKYSMKRKRRKRLTQRAQRRRGR